MKCACLHLVRLLLVLILIGTGLLTTRQAAAQDDGDVASSAIPKDKAESGSERAAEADRHYGEAVRLFGEGRYREAIEEFDRAIAISEEPVFFCNRGIALIKLNEWDSALDDMRTCRTTFEGAPAEVAQIDAQYKGLRTFVRGVRPRAVEVARDIAAGNVSPNVVEVPERQSPWNLELAGHLSLGTGAVLLTAAVTLDYLSADLRDDFVAQSEGGPGTSPRRYQDLRSELETRQTVFTGLTISGAALSVTGISILAYSWFFSDSPAEESSTASSVSVAPTDGGASLQLHLDF
jgi:hypothetical protein